MKNAVVNLLIWLGILVIFFALCLWAYQIFLYLRSGVLPDFSIISSLKLTGSDWAESPDSWLGLWEVFSYIPTSIVLIALGFYVMFLAQDIDRN